VVGRAVEWIDERLFSQRPMEGLVVCRITFGLILFASHLNELPYVATIYGPDGIGGNALRARAPESWPQGVPINEALHGLYRIESLETIWILYGLLLVSSLLFALGAYTRFSGSVTLVLHALFHAHANTQYLGWGEMIKPFLLYVILSNAGDFWSLDAWRRSRRGARDSPAPMLGVYWPQLLLKLHVCTMYATAGWSRLADPTWLNGDMLLVALGDGWYSRFNLDWFAYHELLRIGSYGAFVLEPLAPFLLLIPRTAPYWAVALIGMHVTLEVMTSVGWWQPMMTAALTTFLPLHLLLRWWRDRER
jgi:hypothetical protein